MNDLNRDTDLTPAYVLGHSYRELERLQMQARLIDPITQRFFREAGIVSGMRVLDVGSGAGDVAFLAADIVGDTGEIIGGDRAAAALDTARARATARAQRNVVFHRGDPGEMTFDKMCCNRCWMNRRVRRRWRRRHRHTPRTVMDIRESTMNTARAIVFSCTLLIATTAPATTPTRGIVYVGVGCGPHNVYTVEYDYDGATTLTTPGRRVDITSRL